MSVSSNEDFYEDNKVNIDNKFKFYYLFTISLCIFDSRYSKMNGGKKF